MNFENSEKKLFSNNINIVYNFKINFMEFIVLFFMQYENFLSKSFHHSSKSVFNSMMNRHHSMIGIYRAFQK